MEKEKQLRVLKQIQKQIQYQKSIKYPILTIYSIIKNDIRYVVLELIHGLTSSDIFEQSEINSVMIDEHEVMLEEEFYKILYSKYPRYKNSVPKGKILNVLGIGSLNYKWINNYKHEYEIKYPINQKNRRLMNYNSLVDPYPISFNSDPLSRIKC